MKLPKVTGNISGIGTTADVKHYERKSWRLCAECVWWLWLWNEQLSFSLKLHYRQSFFETYVAEVFQHGVLYTYVSVIIWNMVNYSASDKLAASLLCVCSKYTRWVSLITESCEENAKIFITIWVFSLMCIMYNCFCFTCFFLYSMSSLQSREAYAWNS